MITIVFKAISVAPKKYFKFLKADDDGSYIYNTKENAPETNSSNAGNNSLNIAQGVITIGDVIRMIL